MQTYIFYSLLFFSLSVHAEVAVDCDDDPAKKLVEAVKKQEKKMQSAPGCPNAKKIKNLCMAIDSRVEASSPIGNYKFQYQKSLLEAACIDAEKDSQIEINEKMQKMWTSLEAQLICNNLQFDVPNGNVVKYAVSTYFDKFIDDVATWKVNFNKVDTNDGLTVLDYVKQKLDRAKGKPTEQTLQIYYDKLRKAGAKHKTEL